MMNEAFERANSMISTTMETSADETTPMETMEDRAREAFRVAAMRYETRPDWITFFKEIVGVGGLLSELFPDAKELRAFETSAEYREIQQMVASLREQKDAEAESKEPIRVITVRLPKTVHEFLKLEAEQREKSINQLCIAKLLQALNKTSAAASEAPSPNS